MIYFTSDTHFFHSNIIRYTNRPFKDAAEMNYELIKRWNEKITPNDTVYHLGDFALGCSENQLNSIISQLNFEHMHVVKGNHEKCFSDWYYRNKPRNISFYGSYLETKLSGRDFTLCHYAMRVWNKSHRGAFHLYGHSHGTLPDDPNSKSFDAGVDCHNYFPISLDEVIKIMDKKVFKSIDHHGKQ